MNSSVTTNATIGSDEHSLDHIGSGGPFLGWTGGYSDPSLVTFRATRSTRSSSHSGCRSASRATATSYEDCPSVVPSADPAANQSEAPAILLHATPATTATTATVNHWMIGDSDPPWMNATAGGIPSLFE